LNRPRSASQEKAGGSPSVKKNYDALFDGVLRFRTLEEAEESIRRIEALYRGFEREGDRLGTARAMHEMEKGLRRARMIAKNKRVSGEKRREKAEAALWFETWLTAPGAFWTWLSMRKRARGKPS
jgi:hypothetical protein